MLNRLVLAAAMGALVAACASNPEAGPAAGAPTSPSAAPAAPAAAAPMMNIAATSRWVADERLMPQDPILALINAGGSVDAPAGFWMTCNPANGTITARLGKQPAERTGQSATYRIRMGAEAKPVEGRFDRAANSPEANFVFPLQSVDVRTMAQLDLVSVLTDQGEAQWAFVRDPNAPVQAKYVASLTDMADQSRNFLDYCNPK